MAKEKVKRKGRYKKIMTEFDLMSLECLYYGCYINDFRKTGHMNETVIEQLDRFQKSINKCIDEYRPKFKKIIEKQSLAEEEND